MSGVNNSRRHCLFVVEGIKEVEGWARLPIQHLPKAALKAFEDLFFGQLKTFICTLRTAIRRLFCLNLGWFSLWHKHDFGLLFHLPVAS